jgi:cerevisin
MLIFSILLHFIVFTLAIPVQIPISNDYLAPLYSFGDNIKEAYIVVFKPDTSNAEMTRHINWITPFFNYQSYDGYDDHGIHHTYRIGDFKGYAGRFDDRVLDAIRKSHQVAFVEQDSYVHTTKVQSHAPWGLARISSPDRLTIDNYDKYYYRGGLTGMGIRVYIIDTGIYVDHAEFEGRAQWGITVPRNEQDTDRNGHGTHCAGIVAGRKFGVAKKATVVAVKVLRSDGSGVMSDVLKGVDWTVQDYSRYTQKGAVANMSLGGRKSHAMETAVNEAS